VTDWSTGIRDVPDFPSAGILFRDLTPLWANPELFALAVAEMAAPFRESGIERVVGIEARGFIFGLPIAMALGAGFVPARKPGKLPHECRRIEYLLEYGSAALEVHVDAIVPGQKCLIVDDVLATGGTARAAADLVRSCGGTVAGCTFFLEIAALGGRKLLPGERIAALVEA
jgi:adenine phosphoribosyltransferase